MNIILKDNSLITVYRYRCCSACNKTTWIMPLRLNDYIICPYCKIFRSELFIGSTPIPQYICKQLLIMEWQEADDKDKTYIMSEILGRND